VAIASAGGWNKQWDDIFSPESEDLTSIPMAQTCLAMSYLRSAGVPLGPVLKRSGLTPELVADPGERLNVRSQIAFLNEAASALKDDCLGFTLACDHGPRNRIALLRHSIFADVG
jgi:hypothetical protein